MEHSQIIAAVEVALEECRKTLTREQPVLSMEDVRTRVLSTHPDLDPKRVQRCVEIVWKRMIPDYYDAAESEAEWQQLLAGIEDLPAPEALAIMDRYLAKEKEKLERRRQRLYETNLILRVMQQHADDHKTTLPDLVQKLGVDGFVEAFRAEMLKDDYQDYEMERYLTIVRRWAIRAIEPTES